MSEEITNEAASEAAPQAEGAAQAGTDLSVNDLATIRNIIDVASTRGAFKANELESVGRIYNKLDVFLNSLTAQQKGVEK